MKTSSGDKIVLKESEFLEDIYREEKKNININKYQTLNNFYNKANSSFYDNIQETHDRQVTAPDSICSEEFKRTKYLVEKLSGKSNFFNTK